MSIYFNSHRFTKSGNYFLSSTKIDGKRRWLHVYKWEQHNKKCVPKGFEIHHIDLDKCNNDISNLMLISNKEHNKIHSIINTPSFKTDKQLELLSRIRPLAILAKQGKYIGKMKQRKLRVENGVYKICKFCENEFKLNVKSRLDAKFCKEECREAFHKKRRRKTDLVINCRFCGIEFERRRLNVCCSEDCKKQDVRKRDRERYKRKIQI